MGVFNCGADGNHLNTRNLFANDSRLKARVNNLNLRLFIIELSVNFFCAFKQR